jgi:hypothetical protein
VWYTIALHLHWGRLCRKISNSQEMVQQIVNETQADRELSQLEITELASTLSWFLDAHETHKQTSSEPTFLQLRAQIQKLHNALKVLKSALPAPEQVSLRNYLFRLGEAYAEIRGPAAGTGGGR